MFLFNEIEKIEVAIRNAIVDCGCEMIGDAFWMTRQNNFNNIQKFNHTMDLIETEVFTLISHLSSLRSPFSVLKFGPNRMKAGVIFLYFCER